MVFLQCNINFTEFLYKSADGKADLASGQFFKISSNWRILLGRDKQRLLALLQANFKEKG